MKLREFFFLLVTFGVTHTGQAQHPLNYYFPGETFINSSNPNNRNVNFKDGSDLQDVKRASAFIAGTANEFCSCTLMNNVAQDGSLLMTTAAHCFPNREAGSEVGVVITFNYEIENALDRGSDVDDMEITKAYSIGGTLLYKDEERDIVLLKLRVDGSDDWLENAYAAGWSVSTENTVWANISHPSSDHKKVFIQPENQTLGWRDYGNFKGYAFEVQGKWNNRDTQLEGGSSGSSFYNRDQEMIGIYNGLDPTSGFYYSSALANVWYNEGSNGLATWLDPSEFWINGIPGGYLNDLIDTENNFLLEIAAGEIFSTPGINPNDPTRLEKGVHFLSPLILFDDLSFDVNPIGVQDWERILGINIPSPNSSNLILSVYAIFLNTQTSLYEEKLLWGAYANETTPLNEPMGSGFRGTGWDCNNLPDGFPPCNRSESSFFWKIFRPIDMSTNIKGSMARALAIESISEGDIRSIKDVKIPVFITLKNLGVDPVKVKAVSYPGDVPKNALQFFKPDDFSSHFKSYQYLTSRGENSDPLYIDQLIVRQNGQTIQDLNTGNNGGYLNLVNPNFKIGQIKVSYSHSLVNEIELNLSIANQIYPFNYKVWIDYFNTVELDGRKDVDVEDQSRSYTYNFVDDPVAHPLEEVASGFASDGIVTLNIEMPTATELKLLPGEKRKTRMRVAVSPEPITQDGMYNLGEIEDYLIELVTPTDEEIVADAESNSSKQAHLTGRLSTDLTCDASDEAPADDLEGVTHDFGQFEITGCPEGNCYNTSNSVTYGSSIEFVGSNILELDKCAAFISDGFNERTVAMWIYPTQNDVKEILYDEGGADNGLAIRLNHGSIEVQASTSVSRGSNLRVLGNTSLAMNQWHHVMAVFDDGKLRLYQDDKPAIETDGSSSFTSISMHLDPSAVGGTLGTNAFAETLSSFVGLINNVIIWDYAIPATYALAKYKSAAMNSGSRMAGEEVIAEEAPPELTIFPNPACDVVNILMEVRKAGPLQIKVVDMQGRSVYEVSRDNVSEGHQLITPRGLEFASGAYLLSVIVGNTQSSKRILVGK